MKLRAEQAMDRARSIADAAHRGQSDKTGAPFIEHVRRVAESVEGADQKIVAWLHDVVEKGPGWTLDRLRDEGFAAEIVEAVEAMTKRDGEDYFAFVHRSIRNPLAVPVKHADLSDNLRQARQVGGDVEKFARGLRILAEAGIREP